MIKLLKEIFRFPTKKVFKSDHSYKHLLIYGSSANQFSAAWIQFWILLIRKRIAQENLVLFSVKNQLNHVIRLGKFWNFFATNFLANVARILNWLFGRLWKYSKLLMLVLGNFFENLGWFLCQHLVTLIITWHSCRHILCRQLWITSKFLIRKCSRPVCPDVEIKNSPNLPNLAQKGAVFT